MTLRLTARIASTLFLALLTTVASADHEIGYTETFVPNGSYSVQWCTEAENVNFRVTANATGWVALGFSNNQLMPSSDIIQTNGNGQIKDGWAVARAAPATDAFQDVTLHTATEAGGQTIVEFSRPIDTGDVDDLSLDTPRFLLWAFHATNDSFITRHSNRGFTSDTVDVSAAAACMTTGVVDADFNDDERVDTTDIDSLVMEIIAGTNDADFDLNGDSAVNTDDLDQWRNDGALANGFAEPYLPGDSNLDGTTDAADLNALGLSWLMSPNTWSGGDFTADGIANAGDLNALGVNWQASIAPASPVPEPAGILLLGSGLALLLRHRNKQLVSPFG